MKKLFGNQMLDSDKLNDKCSSLLYIYHFKTLILLFCFESFVAHIERNLVRKRFVVIEEELICFIMMIMNFVKFSGYSSSAE